MTGPPVIDRAETERLCRELGETLAGICPAGIGFALVLFSFDPGWNALLCEREAGGHDPRSCATLADRLERERR